MNCLIVDDNKMARTVLRHQVEAIKYLNLAGECEDAMQAANFIKKEKIDLMLLDVQMPDMSGIDFLKMVKNRPLVILITSRPEYAVDAFEHNVVDYILKPVREDRFVKSILRAKEIHESNSRSLKTEREYFFFREKGVSSKILFHDILYVQAMGDYVTIYTSQKRWTVHYTLSAIEKELPAEKFMRVHRSYIAALDKIDTVEGGSVSIFQNVVPVSDHQRSLLMTRLNQL